MVAYTSKDHVSAAIEVLRPECRAEFTKMHLVRVLAKCFDVKELQGAVERCLQLDENAFKSLKETTSRTGKDTRLGILCDCLPKDCHDAVDLFLWLVEVLLTPHFSLLN
jgi:hypothetical protein